MAVTNKKVDRNATFAVKHLNFEIATAVSLASAVIKTFRPGTGFMVVGAESFCRTKTGAVSFVIKVGGRVAVASGVFTAATRVEQTVSSTLANVKGSATEDITIELTTDGTGALTNGHIAIDVRPYPLGPGEA